MNKTSRGYIFFLLFVLLNSLATAQFLNLDWARQIGGTGAASYGSRIAMDANGNVYTTGSFYGTVDFDPGPATFTLGSVGNYDTFVSKLDSTGNFIWAKRLGNASIDYGTSIAVDKVGSIFVTGIFNDTLDVDPGSSTYFLYGSYFMTSSTFMLKLNTDGNFVWAKHWGGYGGTCNGHNVCLDSMQNIYISGFISGPYIDADPGLTTYMISSWQNNNSLWTRASFSLKLDSAGNFLWVQHDRWDESNIVTALTPGGDVFDVKHSQWVGSLSSSSNFYVERSSSSGAYQWSKKFPDDLHNSNFSIATDQELNVYVSGYFYTTRDFDPGPGVANLSLDGKTTRAMFILKLNATGDFVWVRQINHNPYSGICNMTDAEGNIYVTGAFKGTVDFDPGPDLFELTTETINSYILKLSPSGKFLWAQQLGKGTGVATIASLSMDDAGNMYATGRFTGTCNFNTGNGPVDNHSCQGYSDAFISKMNASGILAVSIKDTKSYPTSLFPNPTTGILNVVLKEELKRPVVRLIDLTGRIIMEMTYPPDYWFQLDLSAQASGIYIIEVSDGHSILRARVAKE